MDEFGLAKIVEALGDGAVTAVNIHPTEATAPASSICSGVGPGVKLWGV